MFKEIYRGVHIVAPELYGEPGIYRFMLNGVECLKIWLCDVHEYIDYYLDNRTDNWVINDYFKRNKIR